MVDQKEKPKRVRDIVKDSPKDEIKSTPRRYAVITKDEVESRRGTAAAAGGLQQSTSAKILGNDVAARSYCSTWSLVAGQQNPRNGWKWHDEEEVETLVTGRAKLWIGDDDGNVVEEYELKGGDWWYCAAGVRHIFQVLPSDVELAVGFYYVPLAYDLATGGQVQIYDRPDWAGDEARSADIMKNRPRDAVKPSSKGDLKDTPTRHAVMRIEELEAKGQHGRGGKGAHGYWIFGDETTASTTLAQWAHEPGMMAPRNGWKWHDEEEVEYLYSGQARLQIGDAKGEVEAEFNLKRGDWWYIAAGVRHRFQVVGTEIAHGLLLIPKAYELSSGGQTQIYDRADWRGD